MPEETTAPGAPDVEMFVTGLRAALAGAQDPGKAPQMQAYMKSDLPYFGISSPVLKPLLRTALAAPVLDRESWEQAIRRLWDEATHREEWYAALALASHRHYRRFQGPQAIPLYEYLITTGAWWDVVDDLATHKVGPLLLTHPHDVTPVIRRWAVGEDLWLRRTAVICQLGAKWDTDLDLLEFTVTQNLEGSLHGKVFWIRKAVGWALRQHARTDPGWVREYVAQHDAELSGLSKREALKHL
ncbi:MAG TPA: DNA alkylation repair protein [Nocardioidaceae bacterium]|nr:DNA alkylation repair protein [Nocardioidaceae bacterium]